MKGKMTVCGVIQNTVMCTAAKTLQEAQTGQYINITSTILESLNSPKYEVKKQL
jgi:hypothetical protein